MIGINRLYSFRMKRANLYLSVMMFSYIFSPRQLEIQANILTCCFILLSGSQEQATAFCGDSAESERKLRECRGLCVGCCPLDKAKRIIKQQLLADQRLRKPSSLDAQCLCMIV